MYRLLTSRVTPRPGYSNVIARSRLLPLRFIRRAQALGFSLDDIRALLGLSSSECEEVQKLATEKLSLVQEKLGQLRRTESVLPETLTQYAKRKGNHPCPILQSLTRSHSPYHPPWLLTLPC